MAKSNPRERRRCLRVGVVHGDRIVDEQLFPPGRPITLGQSPRNSLTVSSPDLPARYPIFHWADGAFHLRFVPHMDGRVNEGDRIWTLERIREAGRARRRGDWLELPLRGRTRGKVELGEVSVLFQLVDLPADAPRPQLPHELRSTLGSQLDPVFTIALSSAVALAAVFWIAVQVAPRPKDGLRSPRLRKIVHREINQQPRLRPAVAPRSRRIRDAAPPDRDAELQVPAARRAQAGPDARAGHGSHRARWRSGARRQDTPDRKITKEELLAGLFPANHGVSYTVLSAGCQTPEECKRALYGNPDLKHAPRDLDHLADLPGAAQRTSDLTGPGSHRTTRRLPAGGSGPITVGNIGTAGDPSGPRPSRPAPRPTSLKPPRWEFHAPPPTPGAGPSVRRKVRHYVNRLRQCYQRAAIHDRTLRGTVRIAFRILQNGRIAAPQVTTGMGHGLRACVRAQVRRWHFGPLPSEVFYGPFQVRFSPGQ